ncbi:MAG: MBL fold metallo-hydrolase [Candidatus Bathyarchaeia archaeon]|jgi:glyoxylase-like metal-dependent hydrolase (beta-lactamase superfamily II)
MITETFTVGMLSTNCYVVNSQQTKEAIIIDPGLDVSYEAQQILDYITQGELKVKLILNTHGHSDHTNGDAIFQEKYNIPIYIHKYDASSIEGFNKGKFPANVLLENGSLIEFGDESLKVIHTPGHTPGSICLLGERLVFTGDTLFAGGIGRTDFPEGSVSDMRLSLQKLVCLPDNFLIYPGHGAASVMGEEKRVNPFLNSKDSFQ